ncbi:MAG: HAMP domain-containing sensor histidine kinase [bacterium]
MMSPKLKEYKLTEVISIVSHQLKTPLSAIKAYIEVLMSEEIGKTNPKQKEYLRDALENIQRMRILVQDILDVSRIEQGSLELNCRPSSLENIVRNTLKDFFSLAQAKNRSLSFKAIEKIPLLNIDPIKIQQVVSNLVSNAIEYNKGKGKVEVIIKKKGGRAVFCCEDTGIGIQPKEREKIFRKFYRGEKAVALATSGSGLGLFISRAIIEKSKGKLWFESKEGKGSTFCFSLPIK